MKLARIALVAALAFAPAVAYLQTDAAKPVVAVAKSPAEIKPVGKGEKLPDAKMKDTAGKETTLRTAIGNSPAVVVFFRGGWCPYCNVHLGELGIIREDLERRGIKLVAISPDKPEKLAAAIAEKKIPYTLLSDASHEAMTKFGIAFEVDAETVAKYKGYGIDLGEWSGNAKAALPVPSVFIADADGIIRFVHTNADYTKRLSGDDVLKAADEATKKAKDEG